MANEVQTPPNEASMTGLLRGIINDIGDLFSKEIKFARKEFEADLRKTRRAAAVLALGAGAAFLGVILLSLMLVHLLHHVSLPAEEIRPGLPLWACFGIVSAVFLVVGSAVSYMGYSMFQSFNPLPDQTAQTVKENVGWIANASSK
jgi:CHASE3 domain sensor protein